MTSQKKLLIVAGIVLITAGTAAAMITRMPAEDNKTMTEKDSEGTQAMSAQVVYKAGAFKKPSSAELHQMLTPLQYQVIQEEGTERPFSNEYDKNTAPGLYVDIVSGEPLYSSKDKYDSGTGWPSFVKPLSPEVVVEKKSDGAYGARIEIRSRIADSHLGHVFDDGPQERGGKRYCMNSAALRFIPKADMEKLGYGQYLKFVEYP